MATLTETFTNIANSIRLKTETTDKITPENMPSMIEGITTGGNVMELSITSNGTYRAPEGIDGYTPVIVNVPQDGAPPAEAFVITGSCDYMFRKGKWDWFLRQYGNQITTKDIDSATYMFGYSGIDTLPFNINFHNSITVDCGYMFNGCSLQELTDENVAGMLGKIGNGTNMFAASSLKKIPSLTFKNDNYYDYASLYNNSKVEEIGDLINLYPSAISSMFAYCKYLKVLPNFINPNFDRINSYTYASVSTLFSNCFSLRSIPEGLMDQLDLIKKTKSSAYPMYCLPYLMFDYCYCLDEVVDLPLGITDDAELTSNIFNGTFQGCYRLKKITFRMNEDGTPRTHKLKGQTINLSHIGYGVASYENRITDYSDCSDADKVYWSATDFPNSERHDNYLEQKDNPNYWTTDEYYSRYNRTSAVETINSLPDTSAYLAEKGGTNTIMFEGDAGFKTDGGAINTMTEEEIAVATAKGWTVSFV